jgi:hypothetical protein
VKMTPQEKAKELVDQFANKAGLCYDDAVDCAYICVEQILPLVPDRPDMPYNYWRVVKEEIEKL